MAYRPLSLIIYATFLLLLLGVRADDTEKQTAHKNKPYKLVEKYDSTNFWNKWTFFTTKSRFTNSSFDTDPTHGFVNYQNRSEAKRLGLIKNVGDEMYMGVDHKTHLNPSGRGRKSVRIESKTRYDSGLFIGTFTHLPQARCGIWPAFWMYGPNWPSSGEIDIYEQWNSRSWNRQTLHTGDPATSGACLISNRTRGVFTNRVDSYNCSVYDPKTYFEGCSTNDHTGPYGSSHGGVYVLEWTHQYIRMWSWASSHVPKDIKEGQPKPSKWGLPSFEVTRDTCKIGKIFKKQRLVLNLDFCGDTAAAPQEWKSTCKKSTGYKTCAAWVGAHPEAFAGVYFQIKKIEVYQLKHA